ncbi:N-acetyltransferase [Enterococcus gilvus]|uniref:GNAT family N-acetyltransferase n=1 Tax=Enterococcus gilvus TaxID=160453 RepID=UPI003D6AEFB1
MNIQIKRADNYNHKNLVQSVNELFYTAFKEKFVYHFFSAEMAIKISTLFSEYICQNKPKSIIIAESDNNIIGCAFMIDHITGYNYLKYLIKKRFSLKNRIKLFIFFAFFSHKVAKEELYIEFLSVSPRHRNKGVGQKLINACKNETLGKKLTLYVAMDNVPALRLYKKEQFQTIKIENSHIGKLLSGMETWQFMEWKETK